MTIEVALEIEVGQDITLCHTEKSLKLSVRLDGVLLLEVLLLHVGGDGLGDVGAALLGATGATEERAELIGERSRKLEDGRLAGHDGLTLHRLLLAATALVSLLLEAGDTLLHALELGH